MRHAIFRYSRALLASLALAAAMPTACQAQTTFLNRGGFDAANPGLPTLDFEGIAPVGSFVQPAPSFAGQGVSFSSNGSSGDIAISDKDFPFGTPSDMLFVDAFNKPMVMDFAPDVNAVGFDLALGFGGGTATVNVYNGPNLIASQSLVVSDQTVFDDFVGFSGYGAITRVEFLTEPNAADFALIDNLAFGGSAQAVPEPGTYALLSALVVPGLMLYRRRRA